MDFSETDTFAKAYKRLYKKYKTLDADLYNLKEVISRFPTGTGSRHWNMLTQDKTCFVYKTRLMCRAVRGSAFRLVYLYDQKHSHIVLIEVYYKGDRDSENHELYTGVLQEYIEIYHSE